MKFINALAITLFVFPAALFSQTFSGVATYQSSTKMELNLDSTQIPPERIKMIKEMMRKQLFKEYTLNFNQAESIFKEVEELDQSEENRGARFIAMVAGGGGIVYKNVQEKLELEQTEFFGKVFLITDTMEVPNWKFGKETKQIGSYTCYKATTTRESITRRITTGEDGTSETDTVEISITAWYTPQIPLSHGPDVYWGLPGMIMEVNNGQTTFLCTRIELKKEDKKIEAPSKGDKVNRNEYTTIVEEKMVEMEKMRGSRGGGGPGRGGNNTFEIKISR